MSNMIYLGIHNNFLSLYLRALVAWWLRFIIFVLFVVSGCSDEKSPINALSIEKSDYLAVACKNILSLFNLESGEWLTMGLGLGDAPNCMISTENKLYVLDSIANSLLIYEYSNGNIQLVQNVDVGLSENRNPWAMALTGDGRLLITNLMQNSLSVLTLQTLEIENLWDTGVQPEAVLVQDEYAYVINTGFDISSLEFRHGSVWVYQLQTGLVINTMTVGINPQYALFDPWGRLHVACTGDYDETPGEIWILETLPRLELVTTIEVDGFPGRLALSDWSMIYAASGGWENEGDNQGAVHAYPYDAATPTTTIPVGLGATDVAIYPETQSVFVACMDAHRVDEIRGDTLYRSFPMGVNQPLVLTVWRIR